MIKIGTASHRTHRPDDLDARLLGTTGCDASEVVRLLTGEPLASTVAAALHPFLADDAPAVPVLAEQIAAAGPDVLDAVRKLYAAVSAADEAGSE